MLEGMSNGGVLENSLFPRKLNIELSHDPAIPTPRLYTQES